KMFDISFGLRQSRAIEDAAKPLERRRNLRGTTRRTGLSLPCVFVSLLTLSQSKLERGPCAPNAGPRFLLRQPAQWASDCAAGASSICTLPARRAPSSNITLMPSCGSVPADSQSARLKGYFLPFSPL